MLLIRDGLLPQVVDLLDEHDVPHKAAIEPAKGGARREDSVLRFRLSREQAKASKLIYEHFGPLAIIAEKDDA